MFNRLKEAAQGMILMLVNIMFAINLSLSYRKVFTAFVERWRGFRGLTFIGDIEKLENLNYHSNLALCKSELSFQDSPIRLKHGFKLLKYDIKDGEKSFHNRGKK